MKRFYVYCALLLISINGIKASDQKYTVPEGTSVANVFTALYRNADVLGMGIYAPNSGKEPSSAINAMQVLSVYCTKGYCDYVRGKCIKVDLSAFPKIDLRSYNRQYGEGAGEKAIKEYTEGQNQIDPHNEYKTLPDPCIFFKRRYLQTVPYNDRSDMQQEELRCDNMKDTVKNIFKFIERVSGDTFKGCQDCRVDYAIESPPINYISHRGKSIQDARNHLDMLNKPRFRDTIISGLRVYCADKDRSNESVLAGGSLPVSVAKEALDKIIQAAENK